MAVLPAAGLNLESTLVERIYQGCGAPAAFLRMEDIGLPCDRALWFAFRQYSPRPESRLRLAGIFSFGLKITFHMWLKQAGIHVESWPAELKDHNGMFQGICDGIVTGITKEAHVLVTDTASQEEHAACLAHGLRSALPRVYCLAQCVMGYTGHKRALCLVCGREQLQLYCERVAFEKSVFEALRARALQVVGNASPYPQFARGSRICRECPYFLHCWHPGEAQQHTRTCGSCAHFLADGLTFHCRHPQYAHVIDHWGNTCGVWEYMPAIDEVPF